MQLINENIDVVNGSYELSHTMFEGGAHGTFSLNAAAVTDEAESYEDLKSFYDQISADSKWPKKLEKKNPIFMQIMSD